MEQAYCEYSRYWTAHITAFCIQSKSRDSLPKYTMFLPKQLLYLQWEQGKYLESEAAIGTAISHQRLSLSPN